MNILSEQTFDTLVLTEGEGATKNWFIEGVYLQAAVKNKNERIYPEGVLDEAVEIYSNDVKSNRAVGELSHPDTLTINMDKICMRIDNLKKEGTDYSGKAKILNTPCGKILQGLLEGGVKIGVSSRGAGSVRSNSRGINEVQNGYRIVAIDAVFNPSAPKALVDGIMEGASWIFESGDPDIRYLEEIRGDIRKANAKRLEEAKIQAFKKFLSHIRS